MMFDLSAGQPPPRTSDSSHAWGSSTGGVLWALGYRAKIDARPRLRETRAAAPRDEETRQSRNVDPRRWRHMPPSATTVPFVVTQRPVEESAGWEPDHAGDLWVKDLRFERRPIQPGPLSRSTGGDGLWVHERLASDDRRFMGGRGHFCRWNRSPVEHTPVETGGRRQGRCDLTARRRRLGPVRPRRADVRGPRGRLDGGVVPIEFVRERRRPRFAGLRDGELWHEPVVLDGHLPRSVLEGSRRDVLHRVRDRVVMPFYANGVTLGPVDGANGGRTRASTRPGSALSRPTARPHSCSGRARARRPPRRPRPSGRGSSR